MKRRGPKKKHWSDLAKTTAWYNRVQWVKNCSDYELDNKYAYKPGFSQKDAEGEKSRIFEGIRKEGRIPRAYKSGGRKLEEIVEAVSKTEGLDDTYDLFYADIWNLLKKRIFTSTEVKSSIDGYLTEFKLERVNPGKSTTLTNLIRIYGTKSVFDRCIRVSLYEKSSLQTLPLLWLIYIQAISPHLAFVREVTELLIDEKIDNLFRYYFHENQYQLFYPKAINQLINTKLDTSEIDESGYGWDIEVAAAWPILPRDYDNFEKLFT